MCVCAPPTSVLNIVFGNNFPLTAHRNYDVVI